MGPFSSPSVEEPPTLNRSTWLRTCTFFCVSGGRKDLTAENMPENLRGAKAWDLRGCKDVGVQEGLDGGEHAGEPEGQKHGVQGVWECGEHAGEPEGGQGAWECGGAGAALRG